MQDIPYKEVDYCKYGMPYRKRTRLWNNILNWCPRPLCAKDCMQISNNKHRQTAQNRPSSGNYSEDTAIPSQELYKIPQELVQEIQEALLSSSPDTATELGRGSEPSDPDHT